MGWDQRHGVHVGRHPGRHPVRLPLADGQWAELRERLLYGQAQPIRLGMVGIKADIREAADLDMALVRGYVSSWHVLDLDGNAVSLDTPELAPDDVIQSIALKAIDLWNGSAALPKDGAATLRSMPKARPSRRTIAS